MLAGMTRCTPRLIGLGLASLLASATACGGDPANDTGDEASETDTNATDTNETKEGRANNRRIEIIVVPDLSTMPGFDELQGL